MNEMRVCRRVASVLNTKNYNQNSLYMYRSVQSRIVLCLNFDPIINIVHKSLTLNKLEPCISGLQRLICYVQLSKDNT